MNNKVLLRKTQYTRELLRENSQGIVQLSMKVNKEEEDKVDNTVIHSYKVHKNKASNNSSPLPSTSDLIMKHLWILIREKYFEINKV